MTEPGSANQFANPCGRLARWEGGLPGGEAVATLACSIQPDAFFEQAFADDHRCGIVESWMKKPNDFVEDRVPGESQSIISQQGAHPQR